MRKILSVLVMVFAFAVTGAVASGPYRDREDPTTREYINTPLTGVNVSQGFKGLLDPSRLQMSHQVGMGYSSMGGKGYTQGYYMNTMSYQFDAPVRLRLRMGMTNNPFTQSSAGPGEGGLAGMLQDAEFFGGADLDWRPTENTFLRISVNRMAPGMGYFYGSYYDMWNSNGYWGTQLNDRRFMSDPYRPMW